jgi:3-phosphoshikimate 1-carboxyvinyltransferase
MTVESDWSSASYFLVLLLYRTISLNSYKETSLQGDSALVEIYKQMGVERISRKQNDS